MKTIQFLTVVALAAVFCLAGCAGTSHTLLATQRERTETTTSMEPSVTGQEIPEPGPSAVGVQKEGETVEVEETTRTRVIKRETVP